MINIKLIMALILASFSIVNATENRQTQIECRKSKIGKMLSKIEENQKAIEENKMKPINDGIFSIKIIKEDENQFDTDYLLDYLYQQLYEPDYSFKSLPQIEEDISLHYTDNNYIKRKMRVYYKNLNHDSDVDLSKVDFYNKKVS